MATTKIWPIKDSLSRVVKYANNPEKTEYADVARVLHYADDPQKSVFEGEKFYLSTSINCRGDPLESMLKVQRHFHAKGENLAYHAYQSFKPGEVTPELCHKIGVETARKIWGSHYQVVVATHLNREHLHNHFVINAVSFRSGKKLDTGRNYWKRVLCPASDEICRKYGLSVVERKHGSTPRKIYEAEKRGEPTRNNLMKEALEAARHLATSEEDMKQYLRDMGYEIRFSFPKPPKIRSIFSDIWVDVSALYEDFDYESFRLDYERNRENGLHHYQYEACTIRQRNGYYKPTNYKSPKSLDVYEGRLSTIGIILEVFLAILGWLPEQKKHRKEYVPLSPEFKAEMREAARKCEMYNCAVSILAKEKITTGEQTLDYIDRLSASLSDLRKRRKPLYRKAAEAKTDFERVLLNSHIAKFNEQIRFLTKAKKALINVLERSGLMKEMIEHEMQMRKEARLRLYLPPPEVHPEAKREDATEEKQRKSEAVRERMFGRVRPYRSEEDGEPEEEAEEESEEEEEQVSPSDGPERSRYDDRDDER